VRPCDRARAINRARRAYGVAPANDIATARAATTAAESFPFPALELAAQMRHTLASVLARCPMLVLRLPGPPKPKGRARTYVDHETGQVRTKTPETTRVYEAHVRDLARWSALARDWPPGGYPGARYVVDAAFVLAEDAADYDNLTKTIDALNGLVWPDDRHVCAGVTTRRVAEPGEPPSATLTIWALRPETTPPIEAK
jgi:endodeoxyribonuclease RusA